MSLSVSVLDEKFMRLAIKKARENIKHPDDGGPFGACIIKDGKVLASAKNTVLKKDATCHAEINAIRAAARKTGSFDLSGSVIYSTTEPCPMCFCAIHWARIGLIVFGTNINDAAKTGFNEMKISNIRLKTLGKSKIKISPGFLLKECRELFDDWCKLPNKKLY
ncbi:MAG: nucleoside deaminase [Candidatus Omnitrophota bacterium]